MTDFLDISYLADGNQRQRRCCEILRHTRVMDTLAPFDPILAGTIPIGIDVPSSDLDIVCEVRDSEGFAAVLRENFGRYGRFAIRRSGETVVCNFSADGEQVEIFGSPVPSRLNNAYRHMLVEHRLLALHGEDFRHRIIELKLGGLKTEPAFARLLNLPGDPYEALLALESRSDEYLAALFCR